MDDPIKRLKEIIKPIGQLDKKNENKISISTLEPRIIESLVEMLNNRATSQTMELRRVEYIELRSAERHLYTYKIVPKVDGLKKEDYDKELSYFKRSLPHNAENFMMQHHRH